MKVGYAGAFSKLINGLELEIKARFVDGPKSSKLNLVRVSL